MKNIIFKVELNKVFQDDKRDIIITDRKSEKDKNGWNRRYYKFRCNRCGFECGEHYKNQECKEEYWIDEYNLLKGCGCPCCCTPSKIVVENINSIYYTDSWMIPIINDIDFCRTHTHGCCDSKLLTCPDCGRMKSKPMTINNLSKYKNINCSCSDGIKYPNKFAFNFLEQLKIDFKTEYNPEWCKFEYKNKLRQGFYDFYFKLNGKKYIIEMDGGFHSQDNEMNGQTLKESRFIDNEKDRLAREHGIEVIRIDCDYGHKDRFKYVKNSILQNDKLNILFDLNKVNWNEVDSFASYKNISKEICKYFNENNNISDIATNYKISLNTVYETLRKGNKYGWCRWIPNEYNKKKIICVTTGKVFNSLKEGSEYYNANTHIGDCCRGKIKSCGFIIDKNGNKIKLEWMYLEDYNKQIKTT